MLITRLRPFFLLLLLCALPLLLAYLWYGYDLPLPSARAHGYLFRPPFKLSDWAKPSVELNQAVDAWQLLFVPNKKSVCDVQCEKMLNVQARMLRSLGARSQSIEGGLLLLSGSQRQVGVKRLWLTTPGFFAMIQSEMSAQQSCGLKSEGYNKGFWLLLDPEGWVVLAYPHRIPPQDILKDIDRLLKRFSGHVKRS